LDADDPAEISEFETDWEEDGGRREKVYREICSSYPVGRFSNAQVRQRRIERLLNKPQKQRLIDDLMRGFYSIFSKVGIEYRACTRTRSSSSQGTAELAPGPQHQMLDLQVTPPKISGSLMTARRFPARMRATILQSVLKFYKNQVMIH
jgi:hypothetical protein